MIPGGLVALLVVSLLLDRQPHLSVERPTTGVTVVIAARNEAVVHRPRPWPTSRNQDLDGPYRVILIDNGSTDGTAEIARGPGPGRRSGPDRAHGDHAREEQRPQRRQGSGRTPLVITVDADTLLHRSALRLLLARYESSPDDVVAVAGSVLVRNSRGSGPACRSGTTSSGSPR